MIFESKMKTGLKDIGKNYLLNDEAILEVLENVAGEHSSSVGYGALDIERTGISWILLDWKVKTIKRPVYADELTVKTWGRYFQRAYTYRDFEVYNSKGELCVIATSKWAIIDIHKHSIARLTDEMRDLFKPEDRGVFEEETLEKLKIPLEYSNEFKYTVTRKDIDINNHMHNTYYLSLACEALPKDVYDRRPYSIFRVSYKHEIKFGDTVTCKYAFNNGKHIIVMMTDENTVNAMVEIEE